MPEEAIRNRAEETGWKDILLPAYEVRKRKEQKTAFIDMLRTHFGDRMRVETCGSLVKSRNSVIGDPETADAVYTAHYDTCAGLPFPNFITPRNLPVFLLYRSPSPCCSWCRFSPRIFWRHGSPVICRISSGCA